MNATRSLPWVLCLGLVTFSVAVFGGLPAELPTKISAAGVIVRTVPKSLFHWFLLPGVAVLTQALLTGIALALPRNPALFNFAEKEEFLKLPREYQVPVVEQMQIALDLISVLVMLAMCFVQWMLWRTALGHPQPMASVILIVGAVLTAPVALLMLTRVSRAFEEQQKRWRAARR